MKKENHVQFWVEKSNELSLGLFAARQEINNLRRMVAIDFEAIEKLIAEKRILIERVGKLEAKLQVLRPVQEIPATTDINDQITDLLLSTNLYPGRNNHG
jgi:hypothetical protein